jgi:hypothetical protein
MCSRVYLHVDEAIQPGKLSPIMITDMRVIRPSRDPDGSGLLYKQSRKKAV